MKEIQKRRNAAALTLILLLAAFLSVFNIWNMGYGNEFYAASVKSMLTGWKNFFFASLDPGGWVTVDKPPVSLWVQTAFAKVFGFYGWSIILPQCLAAVASVAVIYHVVKRHFGSTAGLVSALVLALSPIFIVVSKTNNTDSVLILFMVLSAWAMMVAADRGQLRYLLLSMVLLGIAYNAKTLEAFLILPALYAVYFFGTNLKWRKRLLHLALATLVLAVVSLSWSVIVDLTPASERPYVDNSTNNSELELAFGYNGIQRITGQKGFAGGSVKRGNGNVGEKRQSTGNAPENGTPGNMPGTRQNRTAPWGSFTKPESNGQPEGMKGLPGGGFGGNSMFSGGGNAGILRMFNTTLGGQDSWLLPLGLFSILALLLGTRKSSESDPETRRKLLRNALLWGGAVITMAAYFSISNFFHPYYISVMAPFLAALIGAGLAELWKLYRKGGAVGWLLPISLTATLGGQIAILLSYPSFAKILIPVVCVLTGIPIILLVVFRKREPQKAGRAAVCVAIGLVGLLAAPAVWTSYSVFGKNFNSSIPSAGPSAEETGMFRRDTSFGQGTIPGGSFNFDKSRDGSKRSFSGFSMGRTNGGKSSDSKLIDFLTKNNTGEKFLIAVPSANEAEPIILATGKPVMAVGGFSGNDKTLTVAKLQQMVKDGEIRYFMVGGKGGMGNSNEVSQWVEKNGKAVNSEEWSSSSGPVPAGGMGETIYDLSSYRSK